MSEVRAPRGLNDAGERLWKAVTNEFDLQEHELSMLEQAARVRDRIADLQQLVEDDGLMLESSQGMRLHPGIAETRQQQIALARLLAQLDVPDPDGDLPPARGSYRIRGV